MVHRRAPASELCEALILKQEIPIRFAPSAFGLFIALFRSAIFALSSARGGCVIAKQCFGELLQKFGAVLNLLISAVFFAI